MAVPIIDAFETLDPEMEVDREMAAILLGIGSTRVYDLQREGKLPEELTVQDVYNYETSKSVTKVGRSSGPEGTRRYDVWLTDEQAEALIEEGLKVVDPRVAEQQRKEAREAKARERLAKAGVTL